MATDDDDDVDDDDDDYRGLHIGSLKHLCTRGYPHNTATRKATVITAAIRTVMEYEVQL